VEFRIIKVEFRIINRGVWVEFRIIKVEFRIKKWSLE